MSTAKVSNNQKPISMYPRFLWFLTLCYVVVILLANWFDIRLIRIGGLVTDAGTLIFPLTFLLSDLITEVYGYKNARRAIWCGFLFNAMFIAYGQLVIHLPSPYYPTTNKSFDALLAMNSRIIVASTISYFCSEPLNSYVMSKLKILLQGRNIAARFIASTLLASCVDSFIFGTLAFYGVMSNQNLIALILTMWLMKVITEILGLPISIPLARKLKHVEKMDMYDWNISYNILSLNVEYLSQNNAYK